MAEVKSCLVCGSSGFAERFSAKDCLVSGQLFLISECRSCGFVFTSDPPDEKDIGRYYISEDYISHTDKKRNLTEVAYHLARSIMLRKKYRLISRVSISKTGTLLDVGSGTGYFAAYMKKRGWNVTGIELSEQARSVSVSKSGINALEPSEINGIPAASADCVTFWHVLEHLYDPAEWLYEVRRILKDDGKCIIAIPNIESADARWFGKNWAALDVPRHLWHFSPATITRFAVENGFVCTMIKPMPLDIFYISILSYRNQKSYMPLLRGIITGLLLSAGNLFNKERASSLIYVISKQTG
jgi:2-polyprenyl-3-methyl-5-hydroxy-6-metoxy-1,4-benzoquinol methylase